MRNAGTPSRPLVSVVLPTYNHARFLPRAIDSALNQTYEPIEIVAVDDGSTDETPAVLRAYGDRVRSVRQENGGPHAAFNRGVRESRGAWIAWLGSDDRFVADKIERQLRALEARPEADIVYSDTLVTHEGRNDVTVTRAGAFSPRRLLRVCFIHNGSLLVRRSVFDKVGYFDGADRCGGDWDFLLRAARAGCSFLYIPDPLYDAMDHANQVSKNRACMDASSRRVAARHIKAIGPRALPVFVLRLWDEVLASAWMIRVGAPLRERASAFVRTFRCLVDPGL